MKDYGTLMLVEFLGDPYHPLGGLPSLFGGLDWIVGWNIAALSLGFDVISYVIICIFLITLIQISFHNVIVLIMFRYLFLNC